MQDLPHHYHVNASAEAEGNIALKANISFIISLPDADGTLASNPTSEHWER